MQCYIWDKNKMHARDILDNVEIINVKTSDDYLDGFTKMFDSICKEKIYLGLQQGLSKSDNRDFIENSLKTKAPIIFVIEKFTKNVVGWCDVQIYGKDGKMGIGLIKEYRNSGLGSYVIGIMLEKAKNLGLRNIVLNVRLSNKRAIHVYEKFGFSHIRIENDDATLDRYNESILVMAKRL